MKKLLFVLLFFAVGLIILALYRPVSAQAGSTYSMVCIKPSALYKPSCYDPNVPCLDYPPTVALPISGRDDHNLQLKVSGIPKGQKVYLVGCTQTNNDFKCTAGDATTNAAVAALGFNLSPDPTHEFAVAGGNPPVATDGTITANIHSSTPNGTAHAFYGVYAGSSLTIVGNASSLQYGTFQFNQDASKCVSIRWDPEGRTFDTVSLEPLPNATVKLLDGQKQLLAIAGINPVLTTLVNGAFSFFVPNGTYYLEPQAAGYQFPVTASDINANYAKAYSCDQSLLNNYSIYNQPYPIVEQNKVVHCDIPLKPISGIGYRSLPVTVTYEQSAIPNSTVTKYAGQVSHPLTTVTLLGQTTRIQTVKTTADKFGFWEVLLDNKKLPETLPGVPDPLIISYTKNDLAAVTASFFDRMIARISGDVPFLVEAQNISTQAVVFEPILKYIEGYAYDKAGAAIPFATIKVKLKMSGGSQYQTTADAAGFFKIEPQYLPLFSYYIEVTAPNSTVPIVYTTSQLAAANKTYLAKNKLNLATATKNNVPIYAAAPTTAPAPTSAAGFMANQLGKNNPAAFAGETTKANMILVGLILFLLLLAAGGGLYVYLKKKKDGPPLPL
ncbi:carboxypeptidase regulatory-like domain-containing protein [Candidatus Roizmanbacteria bacterium]|nr:carboxypeptidase regulatory-like domain-containing protein [Candidatus Roizmanbacteria bacterium]